MAESLDWVFELVDKISGPARAAASALGGLTSSLGAAKAAQEALDKASGGGRWRTPSGRFAAPGTPGASLVTGGGGGRGGGLGGFALGSLLGGEGGLGLAAALGPEAVAVGMAFREVVGGIAEFAGAVAKAGFEIGSFVVDVSTSKQSLRIGLETILQDKAQAKEITGRVQAIADTTPFAQKDIAMPIKSLLGAHYGKEKSFDIIKGLGDVSALNGFDPEGLQRMSLAMAKMNSSGKLSLRTLNQLEINSGGLIGRGQVFDELALSLGKSRKSIEGEFRKGKITAEAGTDAILEAIRKNLSGGKLGGAMARFGREIPGLTSTIKDVLTQSIIPEVDDSAGIQQFRGFLRSLADGVQWAKPLLSSSVGHLIDATFGAVFGKLQDGDQDQFFRSLFADIAHGVDWVAETIDGIAGNVDVFVYGFLVGLQLVRAELRPLGAALEDVFGVNLGKAESRRQLLFEFAVGAAKFAGAMAEVAALIAITVGYAAQLAAVLKPVFDISTMITTGPFEQFAKLGLDLAKGLAVGLSSGQGEVHAAAGGLVDTAEGSVRTKGQIHSPSRLFGELGGFMAEGAALGIEGGAPRVHEAAASLLTFPKASIGGEFAQGLAGAAGGAGGAPIQITIGEVHAHGSGDAEETAERTRDVLAGTLADALERLCLERGLRLA